MHSLFAARQIYRSATTKEERAQAVEQIRDCAEQLAKEYPDGNMPPDIQREIVHAAVVLAPEGKEVQMDVAANAAAGGPIDQAAVRDAFLDESRSVREEAVRIATKFGKSSESR